MLAPIALFVYNRPEHTKQTLEALAQNQLAQDSELVIFCDGAKVNASTTDIARITEVRALVKSQKWCKEVRIVEQTHNLGLATSITQGVTELINQFGKVIVLEDDIVTSKGFLRFMNEALDFYEHEEKVMHISGYMFPIDFEEIEPQDEHTFFYRSTSCWGWATWQRAWKYFNSDAKFLLTQLQEKKLLQEFDLDNTYRFSYQLELNLQHKIHTWAVKWYASVFLQKGLCLHPKHSLVQNIGNDQSGDNSPETNHFWHNDLATFIPIQDISIVENKAIIEKMKDFYRKLKISFWQRVQRRIYLFLK